MTAFYPADVRDLTRLKECTEAIAAAYYDVEWGFVQRLLAAMAKGRYLQCNLHPIDGGTAVGSVTLLPVRLRVEQGVIVDGWSPLPETGGWVSPYLHQLRPFMSGRVMLYGFDIPPHVAEARELGESAWAYAALAGRNYP